MATRLNFGGEPFSGHQAASVSLTEAEYAKQPQSRSHSGGNRQGGYRQAGGRPGGNVRPSRPLGRQASSPRVQGRTSRLQPGVNEKQAVRSSSQALSQQYPKQSRWPRRAGWGPRWPWSYRRWAYAPSPGSSEWIAWVQFCLAQAVGPWVPQDGVLGPGTRQAIRTFQEQQQLPATGLLDEGTVTALRTKYSGRQDAAPPAADAQPPDGPPPDLQSSGEPAAAPEAAPANQSDPEGEVSDVLLGRREGEAEREREFSVQSPCRVLLKWSKPKKISDLVDKTDPLSVRYLPEESGLYVIMGQNGKPWYVGVAEASIRGRFQERMKTLRDFNIGQDLLVKIFDREIMWAKAVLVRKPVCVLVRSGEGKKDLTHTLKQPTAPLLIAEQFYIDRLKTYGRGNRVGEIVRFENTGELTIKSVFEDDAGRQRLADAKDPKGLKQLFDSRRSVNKK